MKKIMLTAVTALLAGSISASAHCQIPCGIYGDSARFDELKEHITTIKKSMEQIKALADADDAQSVNQKVRWVTNKEVHADKFTDIITAYFMQQRLKPVAEDDKEAYQAYIKELTLLHKLAYHAMQAKQTVELDVVEQLSKTLHEYEHVYMQDKS